MTTKQKQILKKHGVNSALYAAEKSQLGNGCSNIGFELGIRSNTASALIDAGSFLPRVR
jgi:hypothetical protein